MMNFGINTALSGMQYNANRVSVSANNIANMNTPGFKTVNLVSQSLMDNQGVASAAMQLVTDSGAPIYTGNGLDAAIQGSGYFPVTTPNGQTAYTRQGSFTTDSQGRLTDSYGNVLQPEVRLPAGSSAPAIAANGQVTATLNGQQITVGTIQVANFQNPAGLLSAGGGLFLESAQSGQPLKGAPGSGGNGFLAPGSLESSNVDLATEIVNTILAKQGYSASAKMVQTATDMQGSLLNIKA